MEESDAASIREIEKAGVRVIADTFHDRARKAAALPWLLTGTPLTNRCFSSRKLASAARDACARGVDAIIAYSSCMAQFVEDANAPRVMEFGDLDSEKWRQYAAETGGLARFVYSRESRTLLNFEKRIARLFEVSLVVSRAEAATFEERTGVRPEIVGNGVDTVRFSPSASVARVPGLIVFTGIMNYLPNVEGCVRFVKNVMPRILQKVPNAKFRIVGAQPSKEILALRGGAVEVTGAVPETADYLREASVAVAPLRLGRGLQNKVLEAMACATPIVASPNASAGVDATVDFHYLLAGSDEETAAQVILLLSDPARAAALGARARERVLERYSWDRALRDYDSAIELARNRHRERRGDRNKTA